MNILNFNNKKQKFYKILRIAFDSKYKKKLVVTIIFMLCVDYIRVIWNWINFSSFKTHNRSRIS